MSCLREHILSKSTTVCEQACSGNLANMYTVFNVKSYGGTKSLLISTRSVMGGKNNFLGIAYIVVGGLCIVLGVFFTVAHLIKPRFVQSTTSMVDEWLTCTGNWVTTPIFHGITIQPLLRPRLAETQEDKIVTTSCTNASIGVWSFFVPRVGSHSFWVVYEVRTN